MPTTDDPLEVTVNVRPGAITIGELADVADVPAATIRYHCRDPRGALYGLARKSGRAWLIPVAAADAFAAAYSPYGSLRKAAPDTPPVSGAVPDSHPHEGSARAE